MRQLGCMALSVSQSAPRLPVHDVAVEGAEEVAELRQQPGEVPAGRREGGERAEQESHREQCRRRQHWRIPLDPLCEDSYSATAVVVSFLVNECS